MKCRSFDLVILVTLFSYCFISGCAKVNDARQRLAFFDGNPASDETQNVDTDPGTENEPDVSSLPDPQPPSDSSDENSNTPTEETSEETDSGSDNQSDPESDEGGEEDTSPQDSLTTLQIHAYRSYKPDVWVDGVFSLDKSRTIKLPPSVNVVAGNAGNHNLYIFFEGFFCQYKGGANSSKPLAGKNQTQIQNGLKYIFKQCMDSKNKKLSLAANDIVSVDGSVTVHIDSGDSTASTEVLADIEVNIGCP